MRTLGAFNTPLVAGLEDRLYSVDDKQRLIQVNIDSAWDALEKAS